MGIWRTWGAQVGREVLAVAALVLTLVMQASGPAVASTQVTSKYFGMHVPAADTAWPSAKVGAVNLTTNNVYWPQLETSRGHFAWGHLNALVKKAHAHGAQPLLILGQTPKFHSTKPSSAVVTGTVPAMAPWRAYVSRVAARYKSRIDYQIWPEANAASNWRGTPAQLAKLVVAAAKIIHAKAPKAVVLSPAMVLRKAYQRHAMNRFFASKVNGVRVGHYVDAVAVDAYPLQHGTPEDSAALLRTAHHILAVNKVRAPLWNVEVNYGVAGGHAPVATFGAAKQASYVMRTYLLNAANGVKRVYWLGWAHIDEVAIQMVQADGVTRTAAGNAFATARTWMAGQRVAGCTRAKATHVFTCKLVRAGHASWVYWTTAGTAKVRVPQGARHLQRMGASPTATTAGKRISVTTSPVRVYH